MPTLSLDKLAENTEYNEEGKMKFHRAVTKTLKAVAVALGLEDSEYSIRSNKGGIAVSGEITLHADFLYVQVSKSVMRSGATILVRACNGQKDYSGLQNNYARAEDIVDPARFVEFLKKNSGLFAGLQPEYLAFANKHHLGLNIPPAPVGRSGGLSPSPR